MNQTPKQNIPDTPIEGQQNVPANTFPAPIEGQNRTVEQTRLFDMPSDETVQQVIKRHRNRPDLAKFGEEYTEPGDNSRYLRYARVAMNLPPIDISDPKQVENRINEYFDFCEQNDRKPNMIGMANWIGVSRDTVNTWKNGEYRKSSHSDIVKKALNMLEDLWVCYMQDGKINPASGIFLAKNMFQYKDVADVVVTPNAPYQNGDTEDIDKLVKALPEAETESE